MVGFGGGSDSDQRITIPLGESQGILSIAVDFDVLGETTLLDATVRGGEHQVVPLRTLDELPTEGEYRDYLLLLTDATEQVAYVRAPAIAASRRRFPCSEAVDTAHISEY